MKPHVFIMSASQTISAVTNQAFYATLGETCFKSVALVLET